MPLYSFKCGRGHQTERVFRLADLQDAVHCQYCALEAFRIISCTGIGSCWPEGRVFDHVDETKAFKNYKELERHVEAEGASVKVETPHAIKVRQEERKHRGGRSHVSKKKKELKIPAKVDQAFRHSPTVDGAIKALREGRV